MKGCWHRYSSGQLTFVRVRERTIGLWFLVFPKQSFSRANIEKAQMNLPQRSMWRLFWSSYTRLKVLARLALKVSGPLWIWHEILIDYIGTTEASLFALARSSRFRKHGKKPQFKRTASWSTSLASKWLTDMWDLVLIRKGLTVKIPACPQNERGSVVWIFVQLRGQARDQGVIFIRGSDFTNPSLHAGSDMATLQSRGPLPIVQLFVQNDRFNQLFCSCTLSHWNKISWCWITC